MTYRAGHIAQARWSIRPLIAQAVADVSKTVALVADERGIAASRGARSRRARTAVISGCWTGGHEAWRAAGLPSSPRPTTRPTPECIDFLFFTHGRHEGNAEAARQYLAWETGLIAQLDAQERGTFRI